MSIAIDRPATEITRKRYQRLSRFYDSMETLSESRRSVWREKLWAKVRGPHILEVGVGTGKNIPYWPIDSMITAIDLTPGMLAHAVRRATALGRKANLCLGDVQSLDFPSASFETAVATCVFCSVPDPVLGLRELARVVRKDGQVLLLEHMRSSNPAAGRLMDLLNPFIVRMMGANINRRTLDNVHAAGLIVTDVQNLDQLGIFRLITASPPAMV